jgi:hypothetical protein
MTTRLMIVALAVLTVALVVLGIMTVAALLLWPDTITNYPLEL